MGTAARLLLAALAAALALLPARPTRAQAELGNKLPGSLGLDAGAPPLPGVQLAYRFAWYGANTLVDREGDELPVGLDFDALTHAFGVGAALPIPDLSLVVGVSLGVPVARVRLNTDRPETRVDRFGFGDLYARPLRLGWRGGAVDLVCGYAFYAPTGRSVPGGSGSVGRGHWTHELSAGGALRLVRRTVQVSALASWERNQKKRDVDVTRGDVLQVQGGAGVTLAQAWSFGVAAYSFWQVSDDEGADLPDALRGARERSVGLGPELSLLLPSIRTRIGARYTHDVLTRARPAGGTLAIQLAFAAWRPGN